jgi:hypothetical protein
MTVVAKTQWLGKRRPYSKSKNADKGHSSRKWAMD